jgi:hypothetical protein
MQCPECFFNGGRFYRTLDEPLIPTPLEAAGKVVRINSGHDSNLQRDLVIKTAQQYEHAFYNTSIPNFSFPGPVVFTANGNKVHLVPVPPNLMFVRVRVNTWDLSLQDEIIDYYLKLNTVVVCTFMRYYHYDSIKRHGDYSYKKHVLNDYWSPTPEAIIRLMKRYEGSGVRMCGTPYSSFCKDCLLCYFYYWETVRRLIDAKT